MIHLTEEQLNDLVDELMPDLERAEVERHLELCGTCAGEVARHRTLLGRIALLPRSVEPGVDLRPEIRSRLALDAASRPAGWRDSIRGLRYPLAAAAIVLIVVSSAVTRWIDDAGDPVHTPVGTHTASPSPASFASRESEYSRRVAELEKTLAERREHLDEGTVRLVERNLTVIDRAIAESRAALGADPRSGALQQMLLSTYQHKLELLQRAAEAAS